MRQRTVAGIFVVALSFPSGVARAQPTPDQKATAAQLFDDAQKLIDAGNYADGCPKLVESNRLDPQLGTLLHVGSCLESAGKTASAWAAFKDAVEIAGHRKDAREQKAKAHLAELDRKVPRLTVSVAAGAPSEIALTRDGAPVARAVWGSATPVDPGKHTVSASAPGYRPWSTTIDVVAAASVRVVVPALEPQPVLPVATAAKPVPATAEPAPSEGQPAAARRTVLDVAVGPGFMSRHLKFADAAPTTLGDKVPDYDLSVAPVVSLAAEAYPLARSPGFAGNIGVALAVDYAFAINSSLTSGDTTFKTSAYRVALGLRLRIPVGRSELGVGFDGGMHTFAIDMPDPAPDARTGRLVPGIPKTEYKLLRPGLSGRIALGESAALMLGAGYLVVLDAGQIRSATYFASERTTVSGLDAHLGVGFAIAPGLELRALGNLRRYAYTMSVAPPPQGTDPFMTSGASDLYLGATAMLAYRMW